LAEESAQTVTAAIPTKTPIAWWKLDGNADDVTGNNNNCIVSGNPTYQAGVFGQAIGLDGEGDYVDCGNKATLSLTNQLTLTAWIKVDKFDKEYQTIISKGDNSWRLARAGKSNSIEFACNGTTATKWNGVGEVPWGVSSITNLNDGKWHHVVGVFDGSALYLYIDGVLEAAKAAAKSIDISNYDVCIGVNAQAPGRDWNGLVDDVRIYDYALSQAEIVSVMDKSQINLAEPVPATLFNIAKRYDGQKKYEEAKGVCQLILQRHPDSPYVSNAQIYISKRNILSLIEAKKYAEVQPALDKLIADFGSHPDLPGVLYTIAEKHSNARKFKEAESIYREIIQRFPNDPYAVKAQFNAPKIHIFYLIASGKFDEVRPAIDKFTADFIDNPGVPGILYWFAKELEDLKEYEIAKSVYQQVVREFPDNLHVPKAEVRVSKMDILALIESGNDSEVLAAVNNLIANFRDNPDLPESVFNIGEEYYTKALKYERKSLMTKAGEHFKKAIGVWEKMISQLPSSAAYVPHAYYLSGFCYGRLNEFAKAIQYYQKAADDWPKFEFAWNSQLRVALCYDVLARSGGISRTYAAEKICQACQKLLTNYPKSEGVKEARKLLESWESVKNSQ
jgi:TolA-binding protein